MYASIKLGYEGFHQMTGLRREDFKELKRDMNTGKTIHQYQKMIKARGVLRMMEYRTENIKTFEFWTTNSSAYRMSVDVPDKIGSIQYNIFSRKYLYIIRSRFISLTGNEPPFFKENNPCWI